MAIIKGRDIMLFVKDEKDGKAVSIAQATNHTLNISADTVEISTKDIYRGEWQAHDVNMFSWTASSENLVADDGQGYNFSKLFKIMSEKTKVTGFFGVAAENTTDKWNVPTGGWNNKASDYLTGEMVITSLVMNAPNGDNASFTVEFQGVGPLTPATTMTMSGGSDTPVVAVPAKASASASK